MANELVRDIAKRYGGNFGGSGVARNPEVTNRNVALAPSLRPSPPGQGFLQKVGDIGSQTLDLATQGAKKAGGFVVNTVKDVAGAAKGVGQTLVDLQTQPMQVGAANEMFKRFDDLEERLNRDYGAGKVSVEDYTKQKQALRKARTDISKSLDPIANGPTAQQRAGEVVETAVNVLTLGKFKPLQSLAVKAVSKPGSKGFVLLKQPTKNTMTDTLLSAGGKVETALQTIPAFRDLVARNHAYFLDQSVKQLAGETTSQFLGRNAKNVAIGLLIKRPIVYQTNIESAQNIYSDLMSGEYNQAVREAAWVAAQMVSGGPLGWAARRASDFTGKVRKLVHGKGSFIDELSKGMGNGTPTQLGEYILQNPKAEKTWRIAQEIHLRVSDNNVKSAAEAVLQHYDQHGIPRASITPQQITQDMTRWAEADEIARKLSPKDAPTEYVAVRWDTAAKNGLAARIEEAGDDFKAMADTLTDMANQPGVGWGNNPILMGKLVQAISSADSAASAAAAIRRINTAAVAAEGIPPGAAKRLAKLGYTLATPQGGRKTPSVDFADTRKLVSAVSNGSDIFDEAVAPQPALESLASSLKRFGVSPESNTNVAYDKLSSALVTNLQELGKRTELGLDGDDPAKGAKFILSRLQDYVNKQAPNPYLNIGTLGRGDQSALQDIRQMNLKEIQEALPGITKESAKALQRAVLKSYTDVPLEFRGLGVKAFDYAYRFPGAKTYFRIQSALRYTYNPFFRLQELTETKTLSHLKANNLVWMKPRAELNRVAKLLDDAKIFTSGYTGEATQDLTVGRIHANLLGPQRRDLAGLALDMAEKRGISIEQMVRDHPDELGDALRVIVQYPTKGILNSPLARTLNVAFFPMRYNLKVAGLVAKEVAKLPPTIQVAVIHSFFKMADWMKSPEGIQWQSDNADAIQLFKYFSVFGNVESVYNMLRGNTESVGQLGLLGGLPFGVFSQMMEAQGLIHLNTPYVNPKTGDVLPEYIPQTTKARAAVALQSLLNSMFSYPGRIIGMPGKAEFLRNQVGTFLKTGNDEYLKNIRTEDLTPMQRKWIEVLQNPDVTQEQIDQLYTSPAPGDFSWYTLPPSNLPKPVKVLTRTEVNDMKKAQSGSAPKGKKKALPIPEKGTTL